MDKAASAPHNRVVVDTGGRGEKGSESQSDGEIENPTQEEVSGEC